MSRSRLAAAVAIPVLLAIGLAFTFLRGRQPADTAAPATVPPTTTTALPPPTTSKPNPPKATGEDWLAIMTNILRFRHELYERPQPDLLSQIYDKRCPCYAKERATLADLQRRGWRYQDQGVKVVQARLRGRGVGNSSIVAIESIIRTGEQVLLDQAGKEVQRKAASGPTKMTYELVRGPDGRWRVSFTIDGWIGG
ncbi:MAG TPA: hypothetical protein VGA45_10235 [Actinomycetota bacterium]